ncbi:hypothetical protein JLDGIFFK_00039 [Klebsiella phage vB_KppS-Samwise]|uniref:Uncharacterized protein n=1 Tax=Klebsiella phage vB_KppS-Samwise TaxID=2762815 RepID=A0A7R8MKV3_9CAUD|nr:hypothetical protein OBHDAGOG_00067 [Klebsiella phage vB_KaS-Ahsoka]CAD5239643.1 hypothetical protein JLDGIFFK_00039 [Klebsiella phage vB_KppS-Samwise]CAD5239740.1 hypothetical protein EONHMLJF_00039 [Klebsiella phage vB_KaS-Gatomon]CAJ1038933.1 hypothetical protein SAMARA_00039 [Klebsiella phage vB_KppS-Samwise]CAJ1038982.1 hypothetical protein LLOFRUDD_00001 [Klebsiella phage vB_KppS-Samwise]
MIVTHNIEPSANTAQDMIAGMPSKSHRMVRVWGFQGNVIKTLKEILDLPEVDTALVGVHTNEYVSFHIVTK